MRRNTVLTLAIPAAVLLLALVQRVWGEDTHITVRSVDTLVKRLRRKLEEDPADPKFILTVWGSGYKFADA